MLLPDLSREGPNVFGLHWSWFSYGQVTPNQVPEKLLSKVVCTDEAANTFPWIAMFHLWLFIGVYRVLF